MKIRRSFSSPPSDGERFDRSRPTLTVERFDFCGIVTAPVNRHGTVSLNQTDRSPYTPER
jgi:hypothetical protein